ncbi:MULTISPECIES: hypothetical protein [Gammaproteobacteria]|uniref:hypothetical protein n=1 Tax=Gammaproteobacteria TaxID=1236 RepID=UPI001C49C4AA|nr:hypothetical protein [Pseudomonas sp. Hp2]
MDRVKSAIFLAAVLFGSTSTAHAAAAICNDCDLGKKQTMSRELGVGDHYLWDLSRRTLYHMRVTSSSSGGGGGTVPTNAPAADYVRITSSELAVTATTTLTVKEVSLTSGERSVLSAGLAVYDANGGSPTATHEFSVAVQVPTVVSAQARATVAAVGTRPMTAMDAVTTPTYRDTAIRAALSYEQVGPFYYFVDKLRTTLVDFMSVLSKNPLENPFKVVNIIKFPDGSYFKIQWNWSARDYSYVKGSAIDAAGNPIPETRDQVTDDEGTRNYVYPNVSSASNAGGEMINHLSNLGVGWDGPRNVPVNVSYIVACASTPSGVRCQVRYLSP